jgi:hypothetical protein
MKRFVTKFEAVLEADGRDLTTATRADCEQCIAGLPTPSQRHYGWRALRSLYRFLSEDHEVPTQRRSTAPSAAHGCDHRD